MLPVKPAFGPVRLDLTKLPTPEPAATDPAAAAGAVSSPPERDAKPEPKAAEAKPTPHPAPDRSPAGEPKLVSPSKLASFDLPDLSKLPPQDNPANVGPKQAAPPMSNGQAIRMSEFFRQVNAALRAAMVYPDQARSMGMKLAGRVQIAVHYRDGKAWSPRIMKSSGIPVLDQAVLDAVARTTWPPPPPGLEGREIVLPVLGSFW